MGCTNVFGGGSWKEINWWRIWRSIVPHKVPKNGENGELRFVTSKPTLLDYRFSSF